VVKALLTTSSWPAELPARFVLFAVVRLASRRGVQAWPQPTTGKKKAGSNEQLRSPRINFLMCVLRSDSAGPDYTVDATSAGIPLTPSTGCFTPQSATISWTAVESSSALDTSGGGAANRE
jgi:hypothetical protein